MKGAGDWPADAQRAASTCSDTEEGLGDLGRAGRRCSWSTAGLVGGQVVDMGHRATGIGSPRPQEHEWALHLDTTAR